MKQYPLLGNDHKISKYTSRYWVTPSQTKHVPTKTLGATAEEHNMDPY
jgi:hypothetical protein